MYVNKEERRREVGVKMSSMLAARARMVRRREMIKRRVKLAYITIYAATSKRHG